MKIICVDDEKIALQSILLSLEEIPAVTEKIGFNTPAKCLEYLEDNTADVAFSDINMRKMDGLTLAKAVNAENIIEKDRTGICINKEQIDCDYFNFLDGDVKAVNSYTGEYMSNYYWGEFTIGFLDSKI